MVKRSVINNFVNVSEENRNKFVHVSEENYNKLMELLNHLNEITVNLFENSTTIKSIHTLVPRARGERKKEFRKQTKK